MILHNGTADLLRDGGRAKLLTSIIIFDIDKKLAFAFPQLWMFRYGSEVIHKISYWAVWSTKHFLTGSNHWNALEIIRLCRCLILAQQIGAEVLCNSAPSGLNWQDVVL